MSEPSRHPYSQFDNPLLVEQCLTRIRASTLSFVSQHPDHEALARRVAWIIDNNNSRGRIPQDITPNPQTGIPDSYIDEVLSFLHSEEPTLQALRDGDQDAWDDVLSLLGKRAYSYLTRRGIDTIQASQLAPDFAQTCAVTLLEQAIQRFPYDTYFNAWVSRIVSYEVSQWWRSTKEQRQQQALSLDFLSDQRLEGTLHEILPDLGATRELAIAEARIILEGALPQIPSDEQREVLLRQLAGQSDKEIAKGIGRSKQAIYNLRHRALRALRRILGID